MQCFQSSLRVSGLARKLALKRFQTWIRQIKKGNWYEQVRCLKRWQNPLWRSCCPQRLWAKWPSLADCKTLWWVLGLEGHVTSTYMLHMLHWCHRFEFRLHCSTKPLSPVDCEKHTVTHTQQLQTCRTWASVDQTTSINQLLWLLNWARPVFTPSFRRSKPIWGVTWQPMMADGWSSCKGAMGVCKTPQHL